MSAEVFRIKCHDVFYLLLNGSAKCLQVLSLGEWYMVLHFVFLSIFQYI